MKKTLKVVLFSTFFLAANSNAKLLNSFGEEVLNSHDQIINTTGQNTTVIKDKEKVSNKVMQAINSKTSIYFEVNSKNISDKYKRKIIDFLDSQKSINHITINGYADNTGNKDYNLLLSQKRANSVLKFINSVGVPKSIISTNAYGEENNSSRRVELVIE